jgi:hypothetical protein
MKNKPDPTILKASEIVKRTPKSHETIPLNQHASRSLHLFHTIFQLKGIVSWDFDGLFMTLSYSLYVRHVPLHILFFKFYIFIFQFYHLWFFQLDLQPWFGYRIYHKQRPLWDKWHILYIIILLGFLSNVINFKR